MRILALETSTDTASVAVVADGTVESECTARSKVGHSDALVDMVDRVLGARGGGWAGIDAIAVGLGPGSFTGVRVGLATAKGLRLATDLPLIGVPTLDALASAAVGARGPLVTLIDGKRGEVFAAAWLSHGSSIDPLGAALVGAPGPVATQLASHIPAHASGPILVIGEPSAAWWPAFEAPFGADRLERVASVAGAPQARFVGHLAATGRYARDVGDTLEPVYLRAPSALSLDEQRRLRERTTARSRPAER